MQQNRIIYFDICKGILIIMLIFCHINSMAKQILPEFAMEKLEIMDVTKFLYAPFFMQTFFFLTGFCSNFNKPFKQFFSSNFKSLLIPLFTFATLDQLFNSLVFNNNFLFVEVLGKEFFYLFELFWFLPALFLAKLIMYAIQRITNNQIYQTIYVCILFIFASFFIKYHYHSFNYFHWHNALSMLPFLFIGYIFKKNNLFNKINIWFSISISASYLLIVFFLYFSDRLIPYYTHFHHYTFKFIPLYLWLAFSGSFLIISLSKIMPSYKWLIFLGKNTIIVYGLHFMILSTVILLLSNFIIPSTFLQAFIFYIFTGLMTLSIVYYLCHFFQKKPISYLIGRFI